MYGNAQSAQTLLRMFGMGRIAKGYSKTWGVATSAQQEPNAARPHRRTSMSDVNKKKTAPPKRSEATG